VQVLDEHLAPVSTGETGEICISGLSVGLGYLNGNETDEARFRTLERDGKILRLYRTGDRGYLTPDGELVVVGRLDAQVKVHGMRVDLADIERAMTAIAQVRAAAVLPRKGRSGDLELVAFVVPSNGSVDCRTLRGDLLRTLPKNMVPREFVELEKFPLNPNGKIDRRALADRVPAPAVVRSRPTAS
jgi:acyl-coenzyme A synthetase/AMP-(fatty) acid ligase